MPLGTSAACKPLLEAKLVNIDGIGGILGNMSDSVVSEFGGGGGGLVSKRAEDSFRSDGRGALTVIGGIPGIEIGVVIDLLSPPEYIGSDCRACIFDIL